MWQGKVSKTVGDNFNEAHIKYVWQELHDRFGFNIKAWKKLFEMELNRAKREETEVDVFLKFGLKTINPLLNAILGRNNTFNTWEPFLRFIINKY